MPADKIPKIPFGEYRCADRGTLRRLVREMLTHLKDVDRKFHVLARRPDHAAVENQVDQLFKNYGAMDPACRPKLFGVPVGVKDIFRVDGCDMQCGSLLPPSLFEGEEAECVRRLREAGAIILAQTATTEFAYFEPAATRNPHNPAHTPGGSSSGSAAGVAAGAFPLALGTQTVGSVIRPASYCGVVGFKPTYNLIPPKGVMFFSQSVDHVGFFCRSVAEAQVVTSLFADGGENLSPPAAIRLGVPQGPLMEQLPRDTSAWFDKTISRLADQGVTLVPVPCLENLEEITAHHDNLIAAELAFEHRAWFSDFEHLYRPRTRDKILDGLRVSTAQKAAALASCLNLRRSLTALMHTHSLDAWCCPATLGHAPKGLGNTGSPAMNLPWTHAGMPGISLPVGVSGGHLPRGLQLVGEFDRDVQLLSLASRLEPIL